MDNHSKRRSRDESILLPNHHFVPHRPAHSDPQANFLAIRDQEKWRELEEKRSRESAVPPPNAKNTKERKMV